MALNRYEYKKGQTYYKIKGSIKEQKKQEIPAVLNIHIPGTGGRYNSRFPTYQFLESLRDYCNEHNSISPAIIELEGTGSEGKDYISPTLNAAYTLEKERKESHFLTSLFAVSTINLDEIAYEERGAQIIGVISGAGKNTNNQRIIGALKALEEDGCLPDVIFLSGHSRGAINCISMSNHIYTEFGNKIKLHLMLTDPVPGPGYESAWDTHVVPPNVVTFTVFYAADEERLLFVAHDCTRVIFANPSTTVTCYSVPGDHGSFFAHFGYELYGHMQILTCSINGISLENEIEGQNQNEMKSGIGARKGSVFHCITPINDACPPHIAQAIDNLRQFQGDKTMDRIVHFEDVYESIHMAKRRKELLKGIFKHLNENILQLSSTENYKSVSAIQQTIFTEAATNQPAHHLYEVKLAGKVGYVTKLQKNTLDLIVQANEKAQFNRYSSIWQNVFEKIIELHRIALVRELKKFYEKKFPSPKVSMFGVSASSEWEDDPFCPVDNFKLWTHQLIKKIENKNLSLSTKEIEKLDEYKDVKIILQKYQTVLPVFMPAMLTLGQESPVQLTLSSQM